ncbi:response regulator transcription factor [bacterium]|nr:MAG: response regulator transcription factor [bacterium]
MRLLVVEDHDALARSIKRALEELRYAVTVVNDGEAALDALLTESYALAILDIGLPTRDGIEVCRAARAHGVGATILMLTARDGVDDRVRGLDAGADDYLVKPFSIEELLARVRALLRRAERPVAPDVVSVGEVRLDRAARTATVHGAPLELGATELRLLEYLLTNAGVVLTRQQILDRVWEYEYEGSGNIVEVYVSQLRRKIKKAGAADLIKTVWGVGYQVVTAHQRVEG